MNTDTDLVLELPSDIQAIERTVEYVMERCVDCMEDDRRLRLHFRVGLTEALSNAMLYGNHQDPDKRVRIEVCLEDTAITVRVSDEGAGFDPEEISDPTTPSNLEKPGGRGIFLMKELLDEVRFNDRGNCVTLVLHRGRQRELGGGAQA